MQATTQPLASQLRPTTLDDFIGQTHLVGKDKPIYNALKNNAIFSMLFWGDSGVGKTTLARIIGTNTNAQFIEISAVASGVAQLRKIIDKAKENIKNNKQENLIKEQNLPQVILFIDEIHHFNKSQQDILLPHIESGLITLIGATTENPSFELNNALLSRLVVFIFEPLKKSELLTILRKTIKINKDCENLIINNSNNDARKMLGIIERIQGIAEDKIADFLGKNLLNADNQGDIFYQQLSAFHKSVRGSSPDGALYWFARMLKNGVSATTIARRLLAIASEDIGLADPRALNITLTAWDIYHRVGAKEGERAIAQAIVYCAIAAKSNALYTAFNQVMKSVESDNYKVPKHLCNANTKLDKIQGFKQNYKYAHDFEGGIAYGQTYFPEELGEQIYYTPTNRGLEIKISEKLKIIRGEK